MENEIKVTSLTQEDREKIIRMISWECKVDNTLGDMLLASAKGDKQSLWTIANLVETLVKREQEIIDKVEVFLDERHNFMPTLEEEKEAANF